MIYLTRRYSLAAAHVLAQPSFSADENDRIFGKCANPGGHGHDYGFEVSVTGPLDEETGQIIAPGLLDEIFEEAVARRFSHRLLNEEVPFGSLVPTAENIALTRRVSWPIGPEVSTTHSPASSSNSARSTLVPNRT